MLISIYRVLSGLFILAGGLITSFDYMASFKELEESTNHWFPLVRLFSPVAAGIAQVLIIPIIAGFITAVFGFLMMWRPHPLFSVTAFILCAFLLHIIGSPLVFIGAILGIIAFVKEGKEISPEANEDIGKEQLIEKKQEEGL